MEDEVQAVNQLKSNIKFFNILINNLDLEYERITKSLKDLFFDHNRKIINFISEKQPKIGYEVDSEVQFSDTGVSISFEDKEEKFDNFVEVRFLWIPTTEEGLLSEIKTEKSLTFSKEVQEFILNEVDIYSKKIKIPVRINYE